MTIDVQLLRILKNRKDFHSLYNVLPRESFDKNTMAIADDFKKYFDKHPNHEVIGIEDFIPRFYSWHSGLKDEQKNAYAAILRNVAPDPDPDAKHTIIQDIADISFMTELANMAEQFNNGDLPQAYSHVVNAMDKYKQRVGYKNVTYIDTGIDDLLKEEEDHSGVQWRLNCLNRAMRGLRAGDFGIIAGRPDRGKTSFIASEITFMAGQIPADRNIIWLNNEGPGKRIIPRLYQAALGETLSGLKRRSLDGVLKSQYRDIIGGRLDKIRIFDIHGMDNGMVEMILEDNSPGLIIYDMIDNIKGFGNETRTDRVLESMYQWARERSVKYDAIGLATSQISNDGDGLQFPTMGMLKDSKTGKQGACDFQLMIGASNEPALATSRFIGVPKNKLRREGNPSDPRADVWFNPDTCRYADREIILSSEEAEELNGKGE